MGMNQEKAQDGKHFEDYVEQSGIKLGFELIFAVILELKIP